jgi:gluconolactonase
VNCSHGRRGVERTEPDGTTHVLVDSYAGVALNSPNDLVVKSDGTIWFSDPPYGIASDREGHRAESEIGHNHVYRFDPATGELGIATAELEDPNGLAFSPDESLLYVSDTSQARFPLTGKHHIKVFDVKGGRSLQGGRVFADVRPGLSDGFRLDAQGWLYTSSGDSVQVYHPDGTLMARIGVPEKVGNLTFGGPQRNRLYICASTSLYRITLATTGIQRP